jgi:hypothetical protein
MSTDLVRRWRRIARAWTHAADKLEPQRRRGDPNERAAIVAEQVDCRARAEVLAECARSLECSIKLAARKAAARGRA